MSVLAMMLRAAELFGGSDGTFNAANFSRAMCESTGLVGPVDGIVVAAVLRDRIAVKKLGHAHYKIRLPWRIAAACCGRGGGR